MNRENDEPWSAEEVEEWEHDQWLKIQEMGDEAYMKVKKKMRWRRTLMKKKKEEDGKKKRKEQKKHISRR